MHQGPPRRRRARPVADAPLEALLPRVDELAKGWLLALLEDAPLDDAPGILASEIARSGPRICDAALRALADERDLERIRAGGALEGLAAEAGAVAGGGGAEAAARAVDALGGVLWAAVRAEASWADPDLVAQLAERHALVIEQIRAAALRIESPPGASGAPPDLGAPHASRGPSLRSLPTFVEAADLRSGRGREITPEPEPPRTGAAPRAASGEALWVGAVEDEITRAERTRLPLSLLLVELEEGERVLAVETTAAARRTFGQFAQALRTVLRRQDILACETDTRAWVIARETSRAGGRALAERIAESVRAAEPWRGAPLEVAVGLAVLGEDGRDAASLIDAAEEAKFAAAASGVTIRPDPEH